MPQFKLDKSTREFLANAIEVGGLEGEEGTEEQQAVLRSIVEELRESEADETMVHIAPTPLYWREIGQ